MPRHEVPKQRALRGLSVELNRLGFRMNGELKGETVVKTFEYALEVWHCMALYGTAWHCMALHGTAWHCISLRCSTYNISHTH